MYNILTAPFMAECIATCSNMYRLGWNERNGGNISEILAPADLAPYLDVTKSLRTISIAKSVTDVDATFDVKPLAGKIFLVTGTGKYFKNVAADPAANLGIIRINDDGTTAEVLWGFSDGGRPTSELPAHLRSHVSRLAVNPANRVVMHCHSTNTLAMTYVHPLDDREFTRTLWKMSTECIVVFPEGISVLPWMLCGNDAIGRATAEKMKTYRLCVWAQHGIFAAGADLDETFGLIETVEKAATIFTTVMNHKIVTTIADSELRTLAEAFKVNYRRDFLD
jgi:rhamnulose-1-phosphate aldolase